MGDPFLTYSVDTEGVDVPFKASSFGDAVLLWVDGQPVTGASLSDYAVRLGSIVPCLYRHGRRVTKAWRLYADVRVAADPYGGNANTDG